MSKIIKNFKKSSILIIQNSFHCENKYQFFHDLIKLTNRRFVKNFRHLIIDLNSFL